MPPKQKDLTAGKCLKYYKLCCDSIVFTILSLITYQDFDIDQSSGRIRCKECFKADPTKTSWITRAAAKRHLQESTDHAENVQTNQKMQAVNAARHQQLSATYSALSYNAFDATIPNPMPPVRHTLFDTNNDRAPDIDDFWRPMDDIIIPAWLTPLADDSAIERERLRQEVELLMMEAEQMDEFEPDYFGDDVTTTNVAEHLHSLRMLTLPELYIIPHCIPQE